MENIQTKVHDNRRTRYFVVGLLAVVAVLSFQLYKQYNMKNDLIRRKAFLLGKLRDSRAAEGQSSYKLREMNLVVETQKKQLDEKQTKLKETQNALEEQTKMHEEKVSQLKELQQSADGSKKSLAALEKQYSDASSTIITIQGKLEDTMNKCAVGKRKIEALSKAVDEKEKNLELCMQQKDALEKENQGNIQKQISLLQQAQAQSTSLKRHLNVSPSLDHVLTDQSFIKTPNLMQNTLDFSVAGARTSEPQPSSTTHGAGLSTIANQVAQDTSQASPVAQEADGPQAMKTSRKEEEEAMDTATGTSNEESENADNSEGKAGASHEDKEIAKGHKSSKEKVKKRFR